MQTRAVVVVVVVIFWRYLSKDPAVICLHDGVGNRFVYTSLGNIDRVPCTFYTKTSQYSDLVREYVADDYETLDNDGISQGAVEIREILAASCRDVC